MAKRYSDPEQWLYRGLSASQNLAYKGYHDQAAEVASIVVDAYLEEVDHD